MGSGFLAIWSDIDRAVETDYLHWMSREHAIERVSIPGFLGVRMFRALDRNLRRYFILYELDNAGVVDGADYLARLNQPTPWSTRMMPQLRNFSRGGGHVAGSSGTGRGGFVAAVMLDQAALAKAADVADSLSKKDRIASVRILATDRARTAIRTREKGMRSQDHSFDGLLLVEGLDASALGGALSGVATYALEAAAPMIYETIFSLDRRTLQS